MNLIAGVLTYSSISFFWMTILLGVCYTDFQVLNRAVAADDVSIKITHCGVCYADVVWTKNLHRDSKYPVVPGYVAS